MKYINKLNKIKFYFIGISFISLLIFGCKPKEADIVGKWQHILIVSNSPEGIDSLDMTQFPPNYNVFREDSTLFITNGHQEVNVRYFIRGNQLFSFILGSQDTSIMDIEKLSKEELILRIKIHSQDQRVETLHYKRVK